MMRELTTKEFYDLIIEKGINKNKEEQEFTEFAKSMFNDSITNLLVDCDKVALYDIKNPEGSIKIVSHDYIMELIESGTAFAELFWKGIIPVPKDNYKEILQFATDYYVSEYNESLEE